VVRVTINGVDIVGGQNITIRNGTVVVDGNEVQGDFVGKMELRILEGTIENLTTDRSVTALGISGNVAAGGSVNCDSIGGSVTAGGSVNCDDVSGDVRAGGSVNCDDVGGSVAAAIIKRG